MTNTIAFKQLQRSDWPRDPFGWVFLKRATDSIGAAAYTSWTGQETTALALLVPTGRDQVSAISDALREVRLSGRGIPRDWFDAKTGLATQEALNLAVEFATIRRAEVKNDFTRLGYAVDLISRQCEAGSILTATRDDNTGEMTLLPAHVWNGDAAPLRWRFGTGMIDPANPFSFMTTGRFVFLDASGVATTIKALSSRRDDAADQAQPRPDIIQDHSGKQTIGALSTDPTILREAFGHSPPPMTKTELARIVADIINGRGVSKPTKSESIEAMWRSPAISFEDLLSKALR